MHRKVSSTVFDLLLMHNAEIKQVTEHVIVNKSSHVIEQATDNMLRFCFQNWDYSTNIVVQIDKCAAEKSII